MSGIKIAEELTLPIDAITQTFAEIGKRGSGKTYLASMMAEQMIDTGGQIIVIDPIGNWWGLRVNADGESKGKDIFVIGGSHGDIAVVPGAGKEIARLLVEKTISVVLDISEFRKSERKIFVTDFAEEFYHLKKSSHTPVHIFLEEAQKFVPQKLYEKDEARMLGAWEDIVRLGRNYGIGCSLISQRPQSVNKEVLSQTECLCVLQVSGKHERKALEEWVQEAGEDRKIIDYLPGLKKGEGYVWSPTWLRTFRRVKFNKKTTLDTSATPELGKAMKVAKISKIDIKKLQEYISGIVESSKIQLKEKKDYESEIKRLNSELSKRPVETKFKEVLKTDTKMLERERAIGFNEGVSKTEGIYALIIQSAKEYRKKLIQISEIIGSKIELREVEITKPDISKIKAPQNLNYSPSQKIVMPPKVENIAPSNNGEIRPNICARKIYSFLFKNQQRSFSRIQLAVMTGYSITSSGFINALSQLNVKNLITKEGDRICIGEVIPDLATENVPDFSKEMVLSKLHRCPREIMDVLLNNPEKSFEKEELASQTPSNYSTTSSGFINSISKLNRLELIYKEGAKIKLNPEVLQL